MYNQKAYEVIKELNLVNNGRRVKARVYKLTDIENNQHRSAVMSNVFLEEAFDIVNCKSVALVINENDNGGVLYSRDIFEGILKQIDKQLPEYTFRGKGGTSSSNGKMWKSPLNVEKNQPKIKKKEMFVKEKEHLKNLAIAMGKDKLINEVYQCNSKAELQLISTKIMG